VPGGFRADSPMTATDR